MELYGIENDNEICMLHTEIQCINIWEHEQVSQEAAFSCKAMHSHTYPSSGVSNISVNMYPFNILTDEHVPLKFLTTKKAECNNNDPLNL